ncbi:MAG: hypothetical protein JNM88_09565 [Chitinophagaceae bacterium]|nr:hypothetical protein [Chitinophagaceae bacterium]
MKKWLWLLPLCTVCWACPFESNVALENGPVEKADSSLCGYWYGIIRDGSDFFGIEALDITLQSDSVYAITRYGKAIKGDIILPDTAYFTGYTSYIGEHRYMNVVADILIEEPRRNSKIREMKKQRVYYIARMDVSHDTLTVMTITESFSKKKTFGSADEFKQMIRNFSGSPKELYDEQYSLSYRKIVKPQPVKSF